MKLTVRSSAADAASTKATKQEPTEQPCAGTYCLTGSKDRSIRLWNPHRGTLVQTYTGHGHDVRSVDVCADNSKFVSCGGDKCVFVWDVARGSIVRRFKGHDGAVNDVRYAADEQVRFHAVCGLTQLRVLWLALLTVIDYAVPLARIACRL